MLAGLCALAVVQQFTSSLVVCAAGYVLAWIVVSSIDDLGHLVLSLHDCVHDAADEAALKLLRASDAARAENLEA